jgi:hypothetical protein
MMGQMGVPTPFKSVSFLLFQLESGIMMRVNLIKESHNEWQLGGVYRQ